MEHATWQSHGGNAHYMAVTVWKCTVHHKASRRWTWHSPNGQHHNQIDYILVRKRFQSGVNSARKQSLLEADIGSDHDLLMMIVHLRLKRICKPQHTRLKSDLKTLKDPSVLETFQAMIGGRFAPLTIMDNENTNLDSMITTFNTAVTETASEILGKHNQKKKPWVTAEILDLCDRGTELRKKLLEPEGSEKYREVNNNFKRSMKKATENWIGEQCSETEENMRKNNSTEIPIRERLDHCETRESYYYPRSFRKMTHKRTKNTESMERILL